MAKSSTNTSARRRPKSAGTRSARAATRRYGLSVFVNCPFDDQYREILWAIVFAIHDCGFIARSALEISDSGEVRIEKIRRLIGACRFGLHDLSRTELDREHGLPRFNMPLELGLFLGAKWFGAPAQRRKVALVLDRDRYRYQKYCSDIAGQDIAAHGDDPKRAVGEVRDWLAAAHRETLIPGGNKMWERYQRFKNDLPILCAAIHLDPADLTFSDHTTFVATWQNDNP